MVRDDQFKGDDRGFLHTRVMIEQGPRILFLAFRIRRAADSSVDFRLQSKSSVLIVECLCRVNVSAESVTIHMDKVRSSVGSSFRRPLVCPHSPLDNSLVCDRYFYSSMFWLWARLSDWLLSLARRVRKWCCCCPVRNAILKL